MKNIFMYFRSFRPRDKSWISGVCSATKVQEISRRLFTWHSALGCPGKDLVDFRLRVKPFADQGRDSSAMNCFETKFPSLLISRNVYPLYEFKQIGLGHLALGN